jgi:Icc-related predicted phosphoesterase
MSLRFVCISDTHSFLEHLVMPEGDILTHAGDITKNGEMKQFKAFVEWLKPLSYRHKVIIAGNHDNIMLDSDREIATRLLQEAGAIYLQDTAAEIEGLKFYGSPYAPRYGGYGFMLTRGEPIRQKWAQIPSDVEILLTHSPPFSVLDWTVRNGNQGCEELLKRIGELPKLKAVLCGHLHEGRGIVEKNGVIFVNASICDEHRKPVHQPIVFDL